MAGVPPPLSFVKSLSFFDLCDRLQLIKLAIAGQFTQNKGGPKMNYKVMDEETLYRGRVFNLVRLRYQLPNGKEHTYDLVKHSGAVVIVPLDQQGNIWFVRQFRIGAEESLLELPAGLLEEQEAPEASAEREAREEIGQAAGQLERLGEFYMVPGYSTEKMHVFLATELYQSQLPTDEDEFLERIAVPAQEVYKQAQAGQICDGKTLAALLLAQKRLSQILGVTL
jgi:ADP-ribose pyrophosphatase